MWEKAMQARVRPGLDSYFGYCFERLCREAMPDIYIRDGVNASFGIGEYWNPKTQIDLVGIRDDNWIDIGECKWGKRPSAQSLKKQPASKAAHYPNPRNHTIAFHVFSRTPFHQKNIRGIRLHSLEDLYGSYDNGKMTHCDNGKLTPP